VHERLLRNCRSDRDADPEPDPEGLADPDPDAVPRLTQY
jgi:hypothetical protein